MRVYAQREDNGQRVLAVLKCDGCGAEVKPHPEIAQSGWEKRGRDKGPGTEKTGLDYCPECS